jgi:hypothetical protein
VSAAATNNTGTDTDTIPLRHGGLVVDVPASWSDQSTVLLVAPPAPALPTAHPVAGVSETVTLRFVTTQGRDAARILRDELEALLGLQAQVELGEVQPFACGLGKGARLDATVALDGLTVSQILACVVVGDSAVLGVGTCAATRKDTATASLAQILGSLRPASEDARFPGSQV